MKIDCSKRLIGTDVKELEFYLSQVALNALSPPSREPVTLSLPPALANIIVARAEKRCWKAKPTCTFRTLRDNVARCTEYIRHKMPHSLRPLGVLG